ncbi:MAG TPA: NUDIX domain-containing protein [Chondromyces sp.]|nr:NUDIX domain-containing protein [Chondromyces sp.]
MGHSNEDALKQYDSKKYRTPDGYTSDIAIFTITKKQEENHRPPVYSLQLMLIQRALTDNEGRPNIEAGKWALPGGFVQETETAREAAVRELEEETSISGIYLRHFGIYDRPGRDPRGWIISNAHFAIVPEEHLRVRKAADDAAKVELVEIEQVFRLPLAFDHREIIEEAVHLIKKELIQTTIAKEFLPEEFTLSELQSLLMLVTDDEAIKESASFFRKAPTLPFLELVVDEEGNPKKTQRNSKKPSNLYRFTGESPVSSVYKM